MTNPAEDRPRILVVDDEEAIRDALIRFLGRLRYPTLAASSGAQAVELLAEHPDTALVLSDIRMPGMSGVHLVPQLLATNPDVAIVMLTAVEDPTTAIECMKLGALDYLLKPVDLEELRIQIENALRRRQLEIERRELETWLAREVAARTGELEESTARLRALAAKALVAVVDRWEEATDVLPRGRAAAATARQTAMELGLDDATADRIALAAHLAAARDLPDVDAAWRQLEPDGGVESERDLTVARAARRLLEAGIEAVEHEFEPDLASALRRVAGRYASR